MLRKTPGFTLVAVLALALGIGANSAMFSVVNSVLLRPLPFKDARRLVVVWENNLASGWKRAGPAAPNFLDWKEQNRTFEDMCLLEHGTATMTGFGEPQQVPGLRVTTNFLDVFGGRPALGRTFRPDEGREHNVVLVSHRFWLRYFGGDRGAIGKRVMADGLPYSVIGVLPHDFWSPIPAEVLVPFSTADLRRLNRMAHDFGVIGRLKPDVTLAQADADVSAIQRRITESVPQLRGWGITMVPLQEALVGNLRLGLLVLLGAVGFVLLIACANLANLLLARGAARERETAIRTAMGAGRKRLVRQFLTESMLLGLLGGALGLILALWGVDILQRTLPQHLAIGEAAADILRPDITMDWRVLLFTLLVSIATGLVFGMVPALAASRSDVNDALKEGGRNTVSSARLRLRNAMVVAEVALALMLLVSAGLTLKSFWRLRQVDPGFRTQGILTAEMELPTDTRYRTGREQAVVFRRIRERAAQLPGVRSAALTNILPLDLAKDDRAGFLVEGRPALAPGQYLTADFRTVSAGYFGTVGIPLRRGREIDERDIADRPLVVVIDEAAARRYFTDGRDPIGQRIRSGSVVREVVGVVGEVRNAGLDKEPTPTLYVSFLQTPRSRMSLAVRTAGDPKAMTQAVKNAVYAVDKDQPVYNIRTLDQLREAAQASPRFTLILLAIFAAVALALAAIGIYGVISYSVAQRTGEIGIRIALGAQSRDVLRLVLGQGMLLAGLGVLIGITGALAVTRLLAALLYGISATDAGVFAATSAALAGVAIVASYIPARRAARVDPIVSLRYE